jgi:hypothetical protein
LLLFEDLFLGAFKGAVEQLATATAGIFNLRPWRRERKDLSPHTLENTRFILFLCFTKFLYALYSLLTMKFRQPSHEFTFGVGMSFVSYLLVLTRMSVLEFSVYAGF